MNQSADSSSKIFFTKLSDSYAKNSTETHPLVSTQLSRPPFPKLISPVSNCEKTFTTNSVSSLHQASIFPSFNYHQTQHKFTPMLDRSFQSQINSTVKSSLLNDDKNKAILNSFLQPTSNSFGFDRFSGSGSLFLK